MIKTSRKYRLDWRDAGKGLIVAVVSSVVTAVRGTLESGSLQFNWKQIAIIGGTAGLAYLAKNFLEPAKIIKKPLGAE